MSEPIPPPNNNLSVPSGTAIFERYLNTIGLFIGTYGLAVFLVVYYATVLYPQVQNERKVWIEELTKIRMLVDPETRPVNQSQAEIILRVVGSSLINDLAVRSQNSVSDSGKSNQYYDPLAVIVLGKKYRNRLEGTILIQDPNDPTGYESYPIPTTIPEASPSKKSIPKAEFDKAIVQFQEDLKQRTGKYREHVIDNFTQSKRDAESISLQLGRLRYEKGGTVEELWRSIAIKLETEWADNAQRMNQDPANDSDVRDFWSWLKNRPGWDEQYAAVQKGTDTTTVDKAIDSLRSRLDKEISSQFRQTLSGNPI